MAEFISTFTTGFQDIVRDDLLSRIHGCKIIGVYDGLIHYSYNGNSRDLEKIGYFNNTFFVLAVVNADKITFRDIMNSVVRNTRYYLISRGTFRVRFVNENQFVHVDKNLMIQAEKIVTDNTKLKIDRLNPGTEIWYSCRRGGFGFCGQLISKRKFTEKNLSQGELRPEIAYLICCFANIFENDVVFDPFCGYGAIPVQVADNFKCKKLIASDIDKDKIQKLVQRKQFANNKNAEIFVQDVFDMNKIPDKSIDIIISDPPWGFYEKIENITEFYEKMFLAFRRVMKDSGRVIILSARKQEIENAARDTGFIVSQSINTLVNGKKASVYKFIFA